MGKTYKDQANSDRFHKRESKDLKVKAKRDNLEYDIGTAYRYGNDRKGQAKGKRIQRRIERRKSNGQGGAIRKIA